MQPTAAREIALVPLRLMPDRYADLNPQLATTCAIGV
jgi:hypothetical protein